jgi:hypothetical protein
MNCQKCDLEMVRHAEGTFDEDGWICPNCLAIQKELNPRQTYKGIIVKSLRKAWNEC